VSSNSSTSNFGKQSPLTLRGAGLTFEAYARFDQSAPFELQDSTDASTTCARFYTVWELGACALSIATLEGLSIT